MAAEQTSTGSVGFGAMLKALVLDELLAMTNDAFDLHCNPETVASGTILPPVVARMLPPKPAKGHAYE